MSAGERDDRIVFVLGAALLALYIAQAAAGVEWRALAALQSDLRYKIASGCVLALYLAYQALMARRRIFDPVDVVSRHKLAGALAPLVLYLHASRFAYGYLVLLSSVFVGTVGLGLAHRPILRSRARGLYTWWFVLHLATSSVLLVLSGYHAVIAIAYA